MQVDQERAAVGSGELDHRGTPVGEELVVPLELHRHQLLAYRDDPCQNTGSADLRNDALQGQEEWHDELAQPVEEGDLGMPPQGRRSAARVAQPLGEEPDLHRRELPSWEGSALLH